MSMPTLAVLVVTYERPQLLAQTLAALTARLSYDGLLRFVIADDGSQDDETHQIATGYGDLVITQRGGLGANSNAGLRFAFERADLVLQLQDDMHLLQPLDLTPHVQWLIDHPQDGYIRLWGVGGHNYTATLDQRYWRIDWRSDELYIASDRPHLKHRRFHDAVGLYPEGLPSAATEEAWAHQSKDAGKAGRAPFVLVPHAYDTESNFEHTGWHSRWRDKGL